jgi:MATE family multidrug resistance protein
VLGAGFAAALLGICAAVYLEGIQRPVVVAVAVVSANVLNIGLNWLLIGGHPGVPALGAVGSALSTTAVRLALALVLVGYAWSIPARSNADVRSDANDRRQQWTLGSSALLIQATMLSLVVCLTLFAGRLGPLDLAAFGSVWVLNSPVTLIALGLADATGIQVAKADGSRIPGAPRQTGRNGLRVTLMLQLPLLALWLSVPRSLAALITHDPAFQTRLAGLIPLAGCVMAADGMSFVAVAASRALRDITWSSIIEVGTMALMVALAAYLAFAAGLGVRGLILAAALTAALRCVLLIGRFGNLTRPVLASR